MDKKGVRLEAKNYEKVYKNRNFLVVMIVGFLMLSNLYLVWELKTEKDKNGKTIYVAINDRLYNVLENEDYQPTKDQYFGFSKVFMYNMFMHDLETFDIRTELAKPLITTKSFNYIMSSFENSDGTNIKDLYKKHDAQTIYECDSILMNPLDRGYDVFMYGKRTAVFAGAEDFKENFNVNFKVIPWTSSKENPVGLKIKDFNFIK